MDQGTAWPCASDLVAWRSVTQVTGLGILEQPGGLAIGGAGDRIGILERPGGLAIGGPGDRIVILERPGGLAIGGAGDRIGVLERPGRPGDRRRRRSDRDPRAAGRPGDRRTRKPALRSPCDRKNWWADDRRCGRLSPLDLAWQPQHKLQQRSEHDAHPRVPRPAI